MFALLWMLGCGGGPSVAVSSGTTPDAPVPSGLADALERDFQRPILQCYKESGSAATGSVTLLVHGSHGILKQESDEGADPALTKCATAPLDSPRLQRKLGDGPSSVGFTLSVTFSQ